MTFRKPQHRIVTGYSAALEALCMMIKQGETDTASFRYALTYLGLSEDQAWSVYEYWCEKKLHPLCKIVNQRVHGVEE